MPLAHFYSYTTRMVVFSGAGRFVLSFSHRLVDERKAQPRAGERGIDDGRGARSPEPGLIHHSDQGRLCASTIYARLLARFGIVPSMSRRGNCYDNAVVESFFSSLKNELIHHRDYHTRDQARTEIFEYIELFYNRRRIHQSLDYEPPLVYEQRVA